VQLKIAFHITVAVLSSFYLAGLQAQATQQSSPNNSTIGFAAAIVKDQRMDDQNIVYAYSGYLDKPGLLFIHVTPGDWAAFETYLAALPYKKNIS
jgi:hypothetical protein